MNLPSEIFPTPRREKSERNEIKKQHINQLLPYIPELLEEVEEEGLIAWVGIQGGFVWFKRPVKKKTPNVFVSKNKASKTSIFANGHRKNK